MSGLWGLTAKFVQFLGGTGWAAGRTSRHDLCSFLEELLKSLEGKTAQFPMGTSSQLARSLLEKIAQFPRGTGSQLDDAWQQKPRNSWMELVVYCLELLAIEIVLRLGGRLADHLYIIFTLSRLLGNRGPSHENYAIFYMSNRSTIGRTGWKNCAIVWGRQGQALGVYLACLCNFPNQRSG